MSTDNIIVLSAFAAYLVMMIVIGFVYSKNTKNNEDYFLGGRNLGGWTAAISAQASDMSGWLLMGLPGSVYLAGTGEIWIAVGLLIGTILNWYIVSSRLRKYTIVAGNSLTIPTFFENRYRDKKGIIKIVSAIIIAIFFTVYTASAFSSGAKLFATLFGNEDNFSSVYMIGLIIAAVVILVYTFMGGFKAVCTTDLIQGMLMLVAIMAVPIFAYIILTYNTGFADALVANGVENPDNFLNFMKNDDGSNVSAVSIISNLAWGLGYFGMPHILVRFMSIKKASLMKKSATVAIIWVILSLGAAIVIAYLGRALHPELIAAGTQETIFIVLVRELFPAFVAGILLSAILAAAMSTADSQLLVASSSFTSDIYKPVVRKNASDKEILWVGRIVVIILAVIAYFIAINPNAGSIMGLVENAWAGFGAAFGPVIILSLFWKRFTYKGAIAGIIGGGATVIVWIALGLSAADKTGIYELLPGFIVCLVLAVVVSLIDKAPSAEVTAIFEKATSGAEE